MTHKAGFVNIIGNPNVGKSTIMNSMVGEKLSIVTPKAQTTRHRILGIVSGDNYQIVFSDTPGILKPNYKLHKSMLKQVDEAIEDADIILYITDVNESIDKNKNYIEKLKDSPVTKLIIINKIDLIDKEKLDSLIANCKNIFPESEVIGTSAIKGINIIETYKKIIELLPENPPFYPKDELTDKPLRFFVAETIREKIFLNYRKEIPYSVEIEIDSYTEGDDLDKIKAIIYVERESQKGIIIGHKGQELKKIGIQARQEIEKITGKKVFLELNVKIAKNWKESDKFLRKFGYQL
jgi:GTP-binding protein Era